MTTYTNIINTAPFFKRLTSTTRAISRRRARRRCRTTSLEKSVTKKPSPFTTFYYPPKMFSDAQTTLDVLVTLEDAFIAAYLVGVREFSTPDLRVTAARIMGIESDHRTLARVLGPDVAAQRRRADRDDHRHPGQGRERRPAQQQRLRADARVDEHRPGGRQRSRRSPTRRPPARPGSTRASRTSSSRSRRRCPSRSADFTRSWAEGQTASAAAASAHSRCRGARGPGSADGSAPRRSPAVSGNNAVRFI